MCVYSRRARRFRWRAAQAALATAPALPEVARVLAKVADGGLGDAGRVAPHAGQQRAHVALHCSTSSRRTRGAVGWWGWVCKASARPSPPSLLQPRKWQPLPPCARLLPRPAPPCRGTVAAGRGTAAWWRACQGWSPTVGAGVSRVRGSEGGRGGKKQGRHERERGGVRGAGEEKARKGKRKGRRGAEKSFRGTSAPPAAAAAAGTAHVQRDAIHVALPPLQQPLERHALGLRPRQPPVLGLPGLGRSDEQHGWGCGEVGGGCTGGGAISAAGRGRVGGRGPGAQGLLPLHAAAPPSPPPIPTGPYRTVCGCAPGPPRPPGPGWRRRWPALARGLPAADHPPQSLAWTLSPCAPPRCVVVEWAWQWGRGVGVRRLLQAGVASHRPSPPRRPGPLGGRPAARPPQQHAPPLPTRPPHLTRR